MITLFDMSQDVSSALTGGNALVALETSVFVQGLPEPVRKDAVRRMFDAIGPKATPAATAVIAGRPVVGLAPPAIEMLAATDGVRKAARRDLPVLVARGGTGATTVSAMLHLADLAGIPVAATGGIGGIHRDTTDVSEDLATLAEGGVILVCSGAKSILDLPATVERLESLGVLVLGYQTDEFPGFFSRSTGLPVQQRVDSIEEIVEVSAIARAMGITASTLVVVPVPESDEIPAIELAEAIDEAERTTPERGAARTPAVLTTLARLTGNRTLRANLALLENNARIAAKIALATGS